MRTEPCSRKQGSDFGVLLGEVEPTLPGGSGPRGLHQDGSGDGTAEAEMLPHTLCSVRHHQRPPTAGALKTGDGSPDSAPRLQASPPSQTGREGVPITPLSASDAVRGEVLEQEDCCEK